MQWEPVQLAVTKCLLHRSLTPVALALTEGLTCPLGPHPHQEGKIPGQASLGALPEEG